jgi:hypothetical protein
MPVSENVKILIVAIILTAVFFGPFIALYFTNKQNRKGSTKSKRINDTENKDDDDIESCSMCNSNNHKLNDCPEFDPTVDYSPNDKACKNKHYIFFGTDKSVFGNEGIDRPDEDYFFDELPNEPRNPIKNVNSYNKNNTSTEQNIRDLNDGLLDTFSPYSKEQPSYVDDYNGSEKISKYANSRRYNNEEENDTDVVERVNEFKKSDSKELVGKPIMQIYDKMASNKCFVKAQPDQISHSGYYVSGGSNKTKSFMRDNWKYCNESPINGGSLGGTLYPSDPDSSQNMIISN